MAMISRAGAGPLMRQQVANLSTAGVPAMKHGRRANITRTAEHRIPKGMRRKRG